MNSSKNKPNSKIRLKIIIIYIKCTVKCLFVLAFPTQKAHFEESKYKKPVWLGIKRKFLENVAFWVCEENTQCHKGAHRCILEKARIDLYPLDSQSNYQITLQ